MKYLYSLIKIKKNTILENVIYSASAKAISLIFFTATDILLARSLNIEGYAEWAFFYSITTMAFYICWFGINVSSKIHIANAKNSELQNTYFQAGILLRSLVSGLLCMIMYIIILPISDLLGYSQRYIYIIDMFKLAVILVFLNSFMEFFKECYIGLRDYKKLFTVTISEYFMYFFFSFIFLTYRQIPTSVVWGYICAGSFVLLLNLFLSRNRIYSKSSSLKILFKIKEIFLYSLPLLIVSIGGMILVELDTFMLGVLGAKQDIANYNIVKQICSKLIHINNALWIGTLSTIAYVTKENIYEKMHMFCKIKRLNYLIIIGVCLCMGLFTPVLIPFLYGEQYSQAVILMYWLLPYYALYCISAFYSTFLDFQKKATQRSLWYLSVIFIDVILNYLLIPNWGMKGAACATVVSLIPYTIYSLITTKILLNQLEK